MKVFSPDGRFDVDQFWTLSSSGDPSFIGGIYMFQRSIGLPKLAGLTRMPIYSVVLSRGFTGGVDMTS